MCKKFIFPVSLILLGAMVGNAWSIETASNPNPSNGATCVDPDVVLSWSPGIYANKHNVYFGTNPSILTLVSSNQDPNSYNPGGLQPCKTYYWRIDEVNGPNIWHGNVWSFTTMCPNCCVQPPPNMVAWWPLDEKVGDTSEEMVKNNDGTWMGSPTPVTGKVAGALDFNGVTDYVEVPDDASLNFGTGDLSIDAWVKTIDASDIKSILDKRSGFTSPRGYCLYLNSGILTFQLVDGTLANYYSSLFVADGNWHHVAATLNRDDPDGLKLYVDGVSQTFNPMARPGSLTNDGNLLIGAFCYISSNRFDGSIDEVELFNRALDTNEILAIYQAGSAGKCKCEPAVTYRDDIKWSQPPVQDYFGCITGWDEVSNYYAEPIIADDWVCKDSRPIKGIHWWGSFKGWTGPNQVPPGDMPRAFHIGIWTDVRKSPTNTFSHPDRLIWENICDCYVWSYAGCDVDPRKINGVDTCFEFDQLLSQDKWFYQETNEPNGRVYWLSIAAIYDGNTPVHPWGWKTRPHFYNDDAVRITSLGGQWPPVIGSVWAGGEPIEYPAGTSWDVAFVLTTNREYQPMKWWWPNEETRAADIYPDGIINLKDMAVLAGNWLTEGQVWPEFDTP